MKKETNLNFFCSSSLALLLYLLLFLCVSISIRDLLQKYLRRRQLMPPTMQLIQLHSFPTFQHFNFHQLLLLLHSFYFFLCHRLPQAFSLFFVFFVFRCTFLLLLVCIRQKTSEKERKNLIHSFSSWSFLYFLFFFKWNSIKSTF